LLSERSEKLKAEVEEAMDKSTYLYFGIMTSTSATSMYLSFLYGQPMWVCPSKGEVDSQYALQSALDQWCALTQVHQLGLHYEDYDAVDAALDCMRNLLERYIDTFRDPFQGDMSWDGKVFETSYGRLIADYMVYKPCKLTEWVKAYSCSDWRDSEDIDKALAKRSAEKSQRKADRTAEPDLMERCRYHRHVEKGLPCFLGK
jgi:hypothetical protein